MERIRNSVFALLCGLLLLAGATGCPQRDQEGTTPAVTVPESRRVVEEYLQAARRADGERMYALIATSERDDESPKSLRETAADRYTASTTWEFVNVEQRENTSEVHVRIEGAKEIEPNPYRFMLTREGDAWRIVDSPELHETEGGIRIRID